jgi:hypothetical protein
VRSKQPAGLKIDEAIIAKNQGKLLPVLIDDLPANEFPMGLHAVRAAQLGSVAGRSKAVPLGGLLVTVPPEQQTCTVSFVATTSKGSPALSDWIIESWRWIGAC